MQRSAWQVGSVRPPTIEVTLMATQSENEIDGLRATRPCQSLVLAIQSIARKVGRTIHGDDLSAALGLSWSPVAVPDQEDVGTWPLYARDAFLPEAGRLFGLTIRDLHPPEAALGLRDAEEFEQHFDASYRPLIQRALEHDQPVLAWQGWPGRHELHWGIIRDACKDGIGFRGETTPGLGLTESRGATTLVRPPVQLYVVETVDLKEPDRNELFDQCMRQANTVLGNGLEDRFGVITGSGAYDYWLEHAKLLDEVGADQVERFAAHRRLAAATVSACESGLRYVQRCVGEAEVGNADHLKSLISGLRQVCETLSAPELQANDKDFSRRVSCQALSDAREATRSLFSVVQRIVDEL